MPCFHVHYKYLLVQQYLQLETDCHSHTHLAVKVSDLHCLHSPTGKTMTRLLQMTVTPHTLLLFLVADWPQSLWTPHECLYFRGPLRTSEAGSPNPRGSVEHRLRTTALKYFTLWNTHLKLKKS